MDVSDEVGRNLIYFQYDSIRIYIYLNLNITF